MWTFESNVRRPYFCLIRSGFINYAMNIRWFDDQAFRGLSIWAEPNEVICFSQIPVFVHRNAGRTPSQQQNKHPKANKGGWERRNDHRERSTNESRPPNAKRRRKKRRVAGRPRSVPQTWDAVQTTFVLWNEKKLRERRKQMRVKDSEVNWCRTLNRQFDWIHEETERGRCHEGNKTTNRTTRNALTSGCDCLDDEFASAIELDGLALRKDFDFRLFLGRALTQPTERMQEACEFIVRLRCQVMRRKLRLEELCDWIIQWLWLADKQSVHSVPVVVYYIVIHNRN